MKIKTTIAAMILLTGCTIHEDVYKVKHFHAASACAYQASYKAALMGPELAKGEGYEESKDTGENGDLYLPAGEHPLDDERLDEWDGILG